MAKPVRNIPKADHLIGSMRSMGYTLSLQLPILLIIA